MKTPAIIYNIYPFGTFACPEVNPHALIDPKISSILPSPRLSKIREYYSHLQELQISHVLFGPLFESCTHGYDIIDYFSLDRRLGNNQLLHEITNELNALKIDTIFDGVFNHTSRLFPPFCDLKKHIQNSPYQSWFTNIDFEKNNAWQDGFSYQGYKNLSELPLLNHNHCEVQLFISNIINYWLKNYGIKNWRFDVAHQLPKQTISNICNLLLHDSFTFGEVYNDNYGQWLNETHTQSATNYQLYQTMVNTISQSDLTTLGQELHRQFDSQQGIYKDIKLINFTGNHDTNKLASEMPDTQSIIIFLVIIFTIPGIPCIYYGDEFGIHGLKKTQHDNELRQPLHLANLKTNSFYQTRPENQIFLTLKKLTSFRANYLSDTTINFTLSHSTPQTMFYEISNEKNCILIYISLQTHQNFSSVYLSDKYNGTYLNYLSSKSDHIQISNSLFQPNTNFHILIKT